MLLLFLSFPFNTKITHTPSENLDRVITEASGLFYVGALKRPQTLRTRGQKESSLR